MTAYTYSPNKPRTAANYPLIGNPHHHFYTSRDKPILMAVMHITAGLTDLVGDDSSAEGTIRYSSTTAIQASYHGIVDFDTIQDCLPDSYTAWAQGVSGHSFNSPALSLEQGLGTTNWNSIPIDRRNGIVQNAAIWWAPRVKADNIPRRLMTSRAQIDSLIAQNKPVGFTEHYVLNPESRSDAGLYKGASTYPWTQFWAFLDIELRKLGTIKPPPVVTKPPTAPAKYTTATVVSFQRLLETGADGKWGANTDNIASQMRAAAMGRAFDVRRVQAVINTRIDGAWGPNSKAALAVWVKKVQALLKVTADGDWGAKTDAAYRAFRLQFLNKF